MKRTVIVDGVSNEEEPNDSTYKGLWRSILPSEVPSLDSADSGNSCAFGELGVKVDEWS